MIFWIFAAVLTFVAALCVVLPLSARETIAPEAIEFDKAVYKARIAEIDKDVELGRVSPEMAKATKAEEARKLIFLSENSSKATHSKTDHKMGVRMAFFSGVILLPVAALSAYLALGNPEMSDQSLASRLSAPPEDQSISELVSRAEAHLAQNPQDAKGWAVLAPVYNRMGRYDAALNAWSNVYRLAPETPEIKATLGEAILAVSEGVVTAEAKQLFEAEFAANKASAKARFYLAMALGQEGKHEEAVAAWQDLIRGGTDASPWMAAARSFLAESASAADIELAQPGSPSIPGPNAEQIEAAKDMTAEDRNEMIASMVDGLAKKLAENPDDKNGWQRLIRAYVVLGKKDEAIQAIKSASEYHKSDTAFVDSLNTVQQTLN
ncbi:MAG: c-type cytochrome biogenesis protein CcmI [Salaquimonas sp.]